MIEVASEELTMVKLDGVSIEVEQKGVWKTHLRRWLVIMDREELTIHYTEVKVSLELKSNEGNTITNNSPKNAQQ